VKVAEAWEPDAAMMSNICFAPNHVRAWRRSTYEQIGGHDAALVLADDFDLCCRMYLATTIKRIAQCLYLYRRHDDQTSIARNAELQPYAAGVADRYRYELAVRWARLNNLAALDLGAAHDRPVGFVGLDRHAGADVNVRADASGGLPFATSSVGVVRAHDFLEHVADKVAMMNEIWRVLAPGGWLLSSTPSSDGRGAYQDPTHVSYWNENSFWYYTTARYARYVPEIVARFQANRVRTYYPSVWHEQHQISYVDAALVAVKDGYRPPGLVEW
jgi:SAM-dependent methyltransferase